MGGGSGSHSEHNADTRGSLRPQSGARDIERGTAIPIRDPATRVFLLSQLVAQLESPDQSNIAHILAAGVTPGLVDKLRNLTLTDITRFAAGSYGLSIALDCRLLGQDIQRIERVREDRTLYEAFVRAGASPRLVARLFGVADVEVRRLRRLIAPDAASGGRPRLPSDEQRCEIRAAWQQLAGESLSERERYWELSRRFPDLPVAALECALDDDRPSVSKS